MKVCYKVIGIKFGIATVSEFLESEVWAVCLRVSLTLFVSFSENTGLQRSSRI